MDDLKTYFGQKLRILYIVISLPKEILKFKFLRRTLSTRRIEQGIMICGIIIFGFLLLNTQTVADTIGSDPPTVQSDIGNGRGTLTYTEDLTLYVEPPPPPPKPKPKPVVYNKIFARPLPYGCGVMTQGFSSKHPAVDIAQSSGCQELADAWGVVIQNGFTSGGCGYTIVIDHKNGWISIYCHGNGTQYVKVGDTVVQGQPVQFMGMSGHATGVHLHYGLKHNGVMVNPRLYTSGI